MRQPQIASTTFLAGMNIRTLINDTLLETDKMIGIANYPNQTITLQVSGLHPQTVEQAYLHELVHWILHLMNHALRDDELFVDRFAHLLHQAITKSEFKVLE